MLELSAEGLPHLFLVDFDNVARARAEAEVQDALEIVSELVRACVEGGLPARGSTARDVDVRLYDGWLTKTNMRTDKCRSVEALVPRGLDGLKAGVRIRTVVVKALACQPTAELVGTYLRRGQKMVDQMLAQDMHHFLREPEHASVVLVSNDDDFVPAVISVALRSIVPVYWVRARPQGRNDVHLQAANARVLYLPEIWTREEVESE